MREEETIQPSANAVKVEAGGETGRIRLLGEIDHTAVEQLDQAVADLLDQGAQRLLVDFADLSFFDSACISALVRARAKAEERGGTITLTNVNKYARRILDLTGLTPVFALDES